MAVCAKSLAMPGASETSAPLSAPLSAPASVILVRRAKCHASAPLGAPVKLLPLVRLPGVTQVRRCSAVAFF